ncbi:uncharacterized protein PGTG_19727 [Puccinia graminis f. sp. tritici CRL 75-36-700-3]|uniref:Uncharacterized protein n=1 Tax=Puccinia graminis f. sp. tritici (strain CRL 75-36-700-3 / race SCCL) TaxID=418459 RepID=E3LB18_PUCGT|nr:uncharacterized protein PGTG_19727 [Puccinia graminis f. sp. tritici CRL 75-36-700-3]EFP93743.2 hypothetical protein PGTG_19727 [Puccinia graminis f. sp. tritici CRL 75-36-700-3]
MSEAGCSSTSPDCQANEAAAYTIEDRGSLLDEKQISGFISSMEAVDERSPCPRQRVSYPYDEDALEAENEKLKDELKNLKQNHQRLSRKEQVMLEQLRISEDERGSLEEKVVELRRDYNAKIKLLDESQKQLHAANLELDAMASKLHLFQQEAHAHTSKMERNRKTKEIDDEKRLRKLSRSLQELEHQNHELQNRVQSQELMILELNNTTDTVSSSIEPRIEDEVPVHGGHVLFEELACQEAKYTSENDRKNNTYPHMAPEERKALVIVAGKGRKIDNKGPDSTAVAKFWGLRLRNLGNTSEKTLFWACVARMQE